MAKNIEIPQGKRTFKYRFFEILPGALSYILVALLFLLSWISPILGSIYLLLMVTATLVKAVAVAVRTMQGYKIVEKAERVDWARRCIDLTKPHETYELLHNQNLTTYDFDQHVYNLKTVAAAPEHTYPNPMHLYHAIVMVAYNEPIETMIPSIEAVKATTFPNERIIFMLGYEERGGKQMAETAKALKKKFKDTFYDFIIVEHPDGIRGEIKGKGPNLNCAGKVLAEYVKKKHIRRDHVIVTSLDCDNHISEQYLDYVAYEFTVHKDRQNLSYQPVSLFTNNIWDAPAPMRVIAVSNSFFNIIATMRPHALRNFASHSQPLAALEDMNFWSKRTIVEDGHQYWRSLFHFDGKYDTWGIRVPIYQDAVIDETLPKTLKAQFIQLRRWDYGASDVAYVADRLFSSKKKRKMPFWPLFTKFMRLLDGHVMLAVMAPVVAFGGWVPMLMNLGTRGATAYNLPNVVGVIQTVAMVGLIVTIIFSLKMLPKRPKHYRKSKSILMVVQWILMPIIAIAYQSAAAFYAQTRLMLGLYMEKFDVTKKGVQRVGRQKKKQKA